MVVHRVLDSTLLVPRSNVRARVAQTCSASATGSRSPRLPATVDHQRVAACAPDLPRRHAELGRQLQQRPQVRGRRPTRPRATPIRRRASARGDSARRRRARRRAADAAGVESALGERDGATPPSEQSCADWSSPAAAARVSSAMQRAFLSRSSSRRLPLDQAVDGLQVLAAAELAVALAEEDDLVAGLLEAFATRRASRPRSARRRR